MLTWRKGRYERQEPRAKLGVELSPTLVYPGLPCLGELVGIIGLWASVHELTLQGAEPPGMPVSCNRSSKSHKVFQSHTKWHKAAQSRKSGTRHLAVLSLRSIC